MLIAVFVALSIISLVYLGGYTYGSLYPNQKEGYRRLPDDEDLEEVPMDRWQRIIDEYMTTNIIWALTTYNLMLMIIYVSRYITHTDRNYMREIDVALVSAVLLSLVIVLVLFDYFLFKNPSNGSVFLHYLIAAVFALNFTIDFQAQVGFCEILTLGVFFFCVFLAAWKLWVFIELGTPASKKNN